MTVPTVAGPSSPETRQGGRDDVPTPLTGLLLSICVLQIDQW